MQFTRMKEFAYEESLTSLWSPIIMSSDLLHFCLIGAVIVSS
jgi:hypothetical protein